MIRRNTTMMFGCMALACLVGCGQGDDRVKVYPVSGQVLVRGQPAEGAELTFYPASPDLKGPGMPVPSGVTDENGVFHLRSFDPNDGAPAGEFNVSIIWPEPAPENFTGIYEPKDRLRGRYSNPQKSPLTTTVEEGGGELPPFELELR